MSQAICGGARACLFDPGREAIAPDTCPDQSTPTLITCGNATATT